MSGIFSRPRVDSMVSQLPVPKAKRMPTEDDPEVLAASARTRQMALKRRGRQSTIMTDQLQSTVGSSGQKLGA